MAFDVQISEDSAKLVLSGDIDLQVSGDIKTEIERLSDISRLEIDASEVSYIDSSGVAVLILARQHCTRNNMTLALPSISEAVHRVLQIAKLDGMLPIGDVVSAPEPEEFSFGDGDDALGGGDFGDDDDFVNSLLTEVDVAGDAAGEGDSGEDAGVDAAAFEEAGDDPLAAAIAADSGNDGDGGDFEGLDINAVDFSEPAAAAPSEDGEPEPEPLPDGDALKPGTFS